MRRIQASVSAALAGVLLACSAASAPPADALPELSLMGTVPVYWGEAASLEAMVAGKGEPHWARPVLERHYRLLPIDALDAAALRRARYLLLAQPRALAAAENVALDDWVRGGGRVVILADPEMTGETRYAIGDKRRPQDVTLLSPILGHWGLALEYDPEQPEGYRTLGDEPGDLPVNLAGRFVQTGSVRACRVESSGVIARCTIGRGRAVVVADAAVLDPQVPQAGGATALEQLIVSGFGKAGD